MCHILSGGVIFCHTCYLCNLCHVLSWNEPFVMFFAFCHTSPVCFTFSTFFSHLSCCIKLVIFCHPFHNSSNISHFVTFVKFCHVHNVLSCLSHFVLRKQTCQNFLKGWLLKGWRLCRTCSERDDQIFVE